MRTIYLDMDGVVADFDKFVKEFLKTDKTSHSWPKGTWDKIATNQRLYRDLDKTPEADQLVQRCKEICHKKNWRLLFLTAVPKDDDMPWAFYDKVNWVQKHYPDIPVHFGPYSHTKWRHCIPGDILIDDRPGNIEDWSQVGGNAILHRGDIMETLNQLNKLV